MSRIVCDPKLCSGCLACVTACMDQRYETWDGTEIAPRRYQKRTSSRTGMVSYITDSCRHCEDAPCAAVCPVGALERDENGFVIPLRARCIGCRACVAACPFDVPQFDGGGLVKCDGCAERVSCGLEPACVRTCNTGALRMETAPIWSSGCGKETE